MQGSPQLWVQQVKVFWTSKAIVGMFPRKTFGFWVSETAFPTFWGHFWAKYKGLKSYFLYIDIYIDI